MSAEILKIQEIKELISLAHEFIGESGEDIPFNDSHFVTTWEHIYATQTGSILVLRKGTEIVGALGFLVYKDILSGELKATEAFWFVRKGFRGVGLTLLEQFEEIAKKMKVKRIMMVHLKKLMPEKLKSIYESRGYREIETQYERVL